MIILTAIAVVLGMASAAAQQIAVVNEGGETNVYQTFEAAIQGADPGSVIYLPGGGFTISDDVKITKRLTIIGIGHKSDNGNVDGTTTINGNLFFNEGSSGSAVMACYITGNVYIGESNAVVNYLLIKRCNLNSVQVLNSTCQETTVNQNYIRGTSNFSGSNGQVTNNVLHSIQNLENGLVSHNIILGAYTYHHGSVYMGGGYDDVANIGANTSNIKYNVLNPDVPYSTSQGYGGHTFVYGSNNQCESNLTIKKGFGESSILLENVEWEDVFENYNGGSISTNSNFHFKDEYKQYESQVGVYANGVQFDNQTAPVPYIVAKRIAEETDAAGQLRIQVRVKASE